MAKSTKKKASEKKLTARKVKAIRKPSPKRSTAKKATRGSARPKFSGSARKLLGTNHRSRRLDPFTRGQKEKMLQLRDAMVASMAGGAPGTLRLPAASSGASAFGMPPAHAR